MNFISLQKWIIPFKVEVLENAYASKFILDNILECLEFVSHVLQ